MDNKKPEGKRFSHLYLSSEKLVSDSTTIRRRIGKYFENKIEGDFGTDLITFFEEELGYRPAYKGAKGRGSYGYKWTEFFEKMSHGQFLDSITIVHLFFDQKFRYEENTYVKETYRTKNLLWRGFVQRVFKEEKACFTIDEKGGVHFLYDEEFEKNVSATSEFLKEPQFSAVSKEFDQALKALKEKTPDTKKAVWCLSDGAESLFKILFKEKRISKLTPKDLRNKFHPLLEKTYEGHPRAINASKQSLESFCKWVDSVQQYRHGQKDKNHSPPPLELAVLLVSQGASFLRWMIEVKELKSSK